MNLQITSPYKPCPFKCPYCVSNFEGDYPFENLYQKDKAEYYKRLAKVLKYDEYTGIVFTGMTDPSLFIEWVYDTKRFLDDKFPKLETTFQTSDTTFVNWFNFDVLAYSVSNKNRGYFAARAFFHLGNKDTIIRYNMMLSKDFMFHNVRELIEGTNSAAQYTVKYLFPTSNGHAETDEWIEKNRLELTFKQKKELYKDNVWIDDSCMENAERYRIFREDGNLYADWYTKTPERV